MIKLRIMSLQKEMNEADIHQREGITRPEKDGGEKRERKQKSKNFNIW
jgi:hypothetical protein